MDKADRTEEELTRITIEAKTAAVQEWKNTLSGLHSLPDHVRDGAIASALKVFRLDDTDLAELSMIAEDAVYSAQEKTDAMWTIVEDKFNAAALNN